MVITFFDLIARSLFSSWLLPKSAHSACAAPPISPQTISRKSHPSDRLRRHARSASGSDQSLRATSASAALPRPQSAPPAQTRQDVAHASPPGPRTPGWSPTPPRVLLSRRSSPRPAWSAAPPGPTPGPGASSSCPTRTRSRARARPTEPGAVSKYQVDCSKTRRDIAGNVAHGSADQHRRRGGPSGTHGRVEHVCRGHRRRALFARGAVDPERRREPRGAPARRPTRPRPRPIFGARRCWRCPHAVRAVAAVPHYRGAELGAGEL